MEGVREIGVGEIGVRGGGNKDARENKETAGEDCMS